MTGTTSEPANQSLCHSGLGLVCCPATTKHCRSQRQSKSLDNRCLRMRRCWFLKTALCLAELLMIKLWHKTGLASKRSRWQTTKLVFRLSNKKTWVLRSSYRSSSSKRRKAKTRRNIDTKLILWNNRHASFFFLISSYSLAHSSFSESRSWPIWVFSDSHSAAIFSYSASSAVESCS